ALHPVVTPEGRAAVIEELARLLAPRGQALLAMPLRGSFIEISDLLREYALKHEAHELGKLVEEAAALRPSVEVLGAELEEAGFQYVDVEVRTATLRFNGGREFLEDPVTRLVLLPELRASLGAPALSPSALERPLAYVRDAIDRYFSEDPFELTVQV